MILLCYTKILLTENLMCVLKRLGIKTINWTLGITLNPLKSPNDKSLLSLPPPSISCADYPWRSGPLKACHWPSCSSFAFGDTLENYSWFLALTYRHTKEAWFSLCYFQPRQSSSHIREMRRRNWDDFVNGWICNTLNHALPIVYDPCARVLEHNVSQDHVSYLHSHPFHIN